MSAFMNLHTLSYDQAMFTVAVTCAEKGTPAADLYYDEVDVIAPRSSTVKEIIALAELGGYEDCRVIGVINQSEGFVLSETIEGDLR